MRATGLFTVAVATATMATGCTGRPPAPQWRDPSPYAGMSAPTGVSPGPLAVTSAPAGSGLVTSSAGTAAGTGRDTVGGAVATSGFAAPAGTVRGEKSFLVAVHRYLPEVAVDRRNEEITEMGGEACASLAAGRGRGSVAAEIARYGLGTAESRHLVILARSTLCGS